MKVLVVGGGGREHAIVWKLNQSPLVTEIFCAPGNPGIGEIAKNVDISSNNIKKLVEFSREMKIDITIVGPEEPLVEGIVDIFRHEGLNIIGPAKEAARLEGSKAFSKHFMKRYDIPTAKYDEITTLEEAYRAIDTYSVPLVVKADGLAAGKGVFICESKEEALDIIRKLLNENMLGDAGEKIVIEEFLQGTETSILCFIDGKTIVPMVSSQDHKRVFDGDKGPMTGGMGTYSPNYVYTEEIAKRVEKEILIPTLNGIKYEKMDYKGIIFIGLMITEDGPKVLEYNVRFGDPETQVVLPRLKTDLAEIFNYIIDEKLQEANIEWNDEGVVCVVLASGGYPDKYNKGLQIFGLDTLDKDFLVFHSGTDKEESKIVSNGGRVLGIVGRGTTIEQARKQAYENIERIKFEGCFYRKDIGLK